jgi:hypothetical protein
MPADLAGPSADLADAGGDLAQGGPSEGGTEIGACGSQAGQFCTADPGANLVAQVGSCSSGSCYACAPSTFRRGDGCLPASVAYWTFDEGTGFIAYDSSGSNGTGMNGNLVNGTAWTTMGRVAGAVTFDGVNDRVTVADPQSSLEFGLSSFSYGMWVYALGSNSSYDMPFSNGGSSPSSRGYDVELGTGSWTASLSDGTTARFAQFCVETLGTWVHLTAVVDRSANELRAYLGPDLAATTMLDGFGSVTGSAGLTMGSDPGGLYRFYGTVDDVIIFDRALTAAEVATLAK